jgi:hypothetical protein
MEGRLAAQLVLRASPSPHDSVEEIISWLEDVKEFAR